MPLGKQSSIGQFRYRAALRLNLVRKPLVVDSRRGYRLGNIHSVVNDVNDHLKDGCDDRWSTRAADNHRKLAIFH